MPYVQISITEGKDRSYLDKLSGIIHSAMVETIDCPEEVLYHTINELKPNQMILKSEFRGMKRTADMIFIQMILKEGRTAEKKNAMYRKITEDLHKSLGLRKEDILITVTENSADDWYFGSPGE
jgi:4-oxalocrotonate tautomerase family enzyme